MNAPLRSPGMARRMRSHDNKKAGVSPGLFVSSSHRNQAIASW